MTKRSPPSLVPSGENEARPLGQSSSRTTEPVATSITRTIPP